VTAATAAGSTAARRPGRAPLTAGLAAVFLLGALFAGALVGPAHLGAGGVVRSLLAHAGLPFGGRLSPTDETILWQIRLPRVVLGALVGAMLATAGASYQGVFRNPLADPYLLGVAAGAGLGATLSVAYVPSRQLLPPAAFLGGMVAVALTYAIGRSSGRDRSTATLVLAGVTVVSFFTAIQTFVQQQHSDTLQQVYSWILGSLPSSGWHDVVLLLPYVAISLAAILLHRRLLDVLSLGDEEAASLGVNVGRVRLAVVLAATIGTAAAVAVSGLIGFVGIIVPHAIRLVAGGSYRRLLPLSIVVGAGFLVLADVVARTALSPAELPIGVVTAFCGAPFFAVVLRTSRRTI
jgi:iron complex transport system permease protein